jgi:chemotaxis family two-component system response regulator Rcp1
MFEKTEIPDIKPVEILLVEDNPGDARLAKEALKECRIKNNLHLVEDGEMALDFLYRRGEYLSAPQPELVLLDLNLPKISGHQVLAEIKTDNTLKRIPVVVLSISRAEKDIEESYNLNANCYVTKPLDLNEFIKVFETIQNFWLKTVRLPNI